jgi:hypothetical protein
MSRAWAIVAVALAAVTPACDNGGGHSDGAARSIPTSTAPAEVTSATAPVPTRVLVVGDSLAVLLAFALAREDPSIGWEVRNGAVLGCGILPGEALRYGRQVPVPPQCLEVPALWQRELDELDPELVVVLDGFWDAYDWVVDGETLAFGTPAWDAFASEHFGAAMDTLSARGARVLWLLGPYFRPDALEPQIERYYEANGEYRSALDDARVRHLNDVFRQTASERGCSVAIVDTRPCICPGDVYTDAIEGFEVRGDGVHFTDAGADRLAAYVTASAELARSREC